MNLGRILIRKMDLQSKIEQYGFFKLNILSEQNIIMILDNLNKIETVNTLSQKKEIYDLVLNKVNSKVEYNCINCSSMYFKIFRPENKKIYFENSINDEYSFPSLHVYIPLILNNEEVEINLLREAKEIYSHPRGENISNIFENTEYLEKYMLSESLKMGDCIFSYSHIPYMISNPNPNLIWLSIGVVPYESKSLIYKLNNENDIEQFLMKEDNWFKYLYSDEELIQNKYTTQLCF